MKCYFLLHVILVLLFIYESETGKICYEAKVCIHSGVERCGINTKGELRRFIDSCDMLEYNCLKNTDYLKTPLSRCSSLPPLEKSNEIANDNESKEDPQNQSGNIDDIPDVVDNDKSAESKESHLKSNEKAKTIDNGSANKNDKNGEDIENNSEENNGETTEDVGQQPDLISENEKSANVDEENDNKNDNLTEDQTSKGNRYSEQLEDNETGGDDTGNNKSEKV